MKYVATISAEEWGIGAIKRVLEGLDTKEAYIGDEFGTNGYHHYQCCFDCSGDLELYNKEHGLGWHIENCISWSDAVNYCRKTGKYHYFGNSVEEREFRTIRSRPPLPIWNDFESSINRQNDREVTIWIDRKGSSSKSSWSYLQCRSGRALSIPRTESDGHRMNDYICMNYGNEEMVILDLPREESLTKEHTRVLEDLKDGNLSTAKYQGEKRFIRGVKCIVFTNNYIDPKIYKTLTEDRWDIHEIDKTGKVFKVEKSEGDTSR